MKRFAGGGGTSLAVAQGDGLSEWASARIRLPGVGLAGVPQRPSPTRAQPAPRPAVVRATPRSPGPRMPFVLNGRRRGRKWKGPLQRTRRGGPRVRRVFIEEQNRGTWSSMCVLCKESDGHRGQWTHGTRRPRPPSMQMKRHRGQWRAPGAGSGGGHRERSRFPLCDSCESAAAAAAAAGCLAGYALLSAAAAAGSAGRARTVHRTG